MKDYFPEETAEKSLGFKLILILVGLLTLSIMGVRAYTLFNPPIAVDPTQTVEPIWYSYAVLALGVLVILGLFFTYQYKKLGVYLVPISLFLIIVLAPDFSLQNTLHPLFTLFIYCGYGLFEIIPKWKFFR